jgi:hypothetical protein
VTPVGHAPQCTAVDPAMQATMLHLIPNVASGKSVVPSALQICQRAGLRLFFWERSGDPEKGWKRAEGKRWNRRDAVEDLSKYDPAKHNVGTITGTEISPGKFLADVDIDWSPPGDLIDLLPETSFIFGRPSKPVSHLFYTTPERLPSVKDYKDIDGSKFVELFGGDFSEYTMVPPSLRSPGEPLQWFGNFEERTPAHVSVEKLHNGVRNYAIGVVLYKHLGHRAVLHEQRLAVAGFLLKEGLPEGDVKAIGEALTLATANDKDDWITAFTTTKDRIKAGQKVSGKTKLIESFGDAGKRVVALIKRIVGNSEFITDQHGKVLADNTENIRTALDKLDVRLMFDSFAEQLIVQRGSAPPVLLDDYTSIPLRFDIEEQYRFRPAEKLFDDLLRDTAYRNKVHPVRQYLDGLTWDGVPRINEWLVTYGKASDTPFVRSVSTKVLIAAVRRIRQPGCKFDEMLVLESEQGKAKSTAIQSLCPNPEWFSDGLPLGVDAQKIVEQTSGKWIIEASELHGNRGKEAEHLKAFLSRGTDGPVRLAYHHFATQRRRQFVLIGTTNAVTGYLKDSTGGRRFWPVRIREFDVAALAADRDQLWAEAAVREARGESIRLEEELWAAAAIEQEDRRQEDPWEEPIHEFIEQCKAGLPGDQYAGMCIPAEYLWVALGKHGCNMRSTTDAPRVEAIMQLLGFTKRRRLYIWLEVNTADQAGKPITKKTKVQKKCWIKEGLPKDYVLDWSLPFYLTSGE